jgi:hypothetical protein
MFSPSLGIRKRRLLTLKNGRFLVASPSNSALGVIEDRLLIQLAHALFAMTAAEFLAKAWKLANDNARELGWIV